MKGSKDNDVSDTGSIVEVEDDEPPKDHRLSPILSLSDKDDLAVIPFPNKTRRKKKSKSKSSTPRQALQEDDGKRDVYENMDED